MKLVKRVDTYTKIYHGEKVFGYTCTKCSKFYKMWCNYLKHKCEAPEFKCPHCPYVAFKSSILEFEGAYDGLCLSELPKNYWKNIYERGGGAGGGGPNTCFKCGKTYVHFYTLKRHLDYECQVIPKFRCSYCSRRSKHKSDMKDHITRIHKNKPITFYELLDNDVETRLELFFMIRVIYYDQIYVDDPLALPGPSQQPYPLWFPNRYSHVCNVCYRSYKHYTTLIRHKKYECQKVASLKCQFCPHRFKRTDHLKAHTLNCKLKKDTRIQFVEVQDILASGSVLKPQPKRGRARMGHRGRRQMVDRCRFLCPRCPSSFSYLRGLQQHIKYACRKSPRFQCPYCGQRAKYRYAAYNHVRQMHKQEEVYCIDTLAEASQS
ncbi:zinc finger protein 181-like [Copidosoma floridanum]|uniref:zinc finger protein 181-like n=1 Tax=Copidosoma floridanum TaxID=29053 RepID=UPI000C6FBFD2|nr:zinc finger protein 181-like [Copidosoma floridanum]